MPAAIMVYHIGGNRFSAQRMLQNAWVRPMNESFLLIVGAADTGRAPLAAAMLRRILASDGIAARVESAGILGHDGDPASPDAVTVADQLEIDLAAHRARSLTEELANDAMLLIAIDSGAARVARMQFPAVAARIESLGGLAGRERDVPDPFKMQIGPWLIYAQEIERMLRQALPRILSYLPNAAPATPPTPSPVVPGVAEARRVEAERCAQLLEVMRQNREVVIWSAAREQIEATIAVAVAHPASATDMVAAYGALLRAALALTAAAPSAGQLAALQDALSRLDQPIEADAIGALSLQLGGWAML